ncbi:MAG: hybrid sensor histidine kinase/response regulator [Desulfobacterales bacterium]|nr:hybrid sensor histidine kinase/response regulator [Desulfobacterales bacterium]
MDDKDIIDEFILEAKEHLDTIEDDFLLLEKQKDNPDQELVNKVFRPIHSIKGAAGFLGFSKISELTHAMETLLSMIRAGEVRAESEFIDALLKGVDHLSIMIDDIEHSNEMDISKVHDHLNSILGRAMSPKVRNEMNTTVHLSNSKGDEVGFDINKFTLKNIPSNMLLYVLKYDLTALSKTRGPLELIRKLLNSGEILDANIDIPSDDLHDGLPEEPLTYELLYATAIQPDDIQKATELPDERIIHIQREPGTADQDKMAEYEQHPPGPPQGGNLQRLPEKPPEKTDDPETTVVYSENVPPPSEPLAEEEPESQTPAKSARLSIGFSNSIRINVDILDKLMMLAGELVLVRNQQLISADSSEPVSKSIVQRLDIVTTELQETIMRTRMQPIEKIFAKFPRVVRELGKKLGKHIEISITGSEVELDKTILESLADPLIHLIRNCCDHGIESPEQRISAGKPETGHIQINACHEAGRINIEIRDDGAGIDPKIIRQKVIEKGMKTEAELERMNDREIMQLILLPGFSSAESISEVSGRGVGMDVVMAGVEKLGGNLDFESRAGQGTHFHLRLPLTLAIIPCLIVGVGKNRYAIPQVNLVELVCLYDEDVKTKIERADDQEVYRLRDRLLPMVRLSESLSRPEPFTREVRSEITEHYRNFQYPESSHSLNFAVVKVRADRFGLIIDSVLGTEEIVVKPMHSAMKFLDIYSGATVMGDGKVALILDIESIAAHAGLTFDDTDRSSVHAKGDRDLQTVLLFKYGEKEQFAIALPIIRRVERISVSEIEHIGEKEFITINGISTLVLRPDKVLNVSPGNEKEEMFLILPKYIKRPVGLLASTLVDIEESPVKLNADSYVEDGIMGTSIIRGCMTLFTDMFRLVEKAEPEWFSDRRKEAPPPDDTKKILLVEDASFFRHLVKGYLESDGYSVITAENGQLGLDRINDTTFDLVVSDIEMPVMNGWDFLKNVRRGSRQHGIPAVALTALNSEKDRIKALKCGYDRYEVKIDREKFLTAVAELLNETGNLKLET